MLLEPEVTTTIILVGVDVQLPTTEVAITVYVPEAAILASIKLGFCCELANPFGPIHDQVTEPVVLVLADRFNVLPLQIGPFCEATGVAGVLIVTVTVLEVYTLLLPSVTLQ